MASVMLPRSVTISKIFAVKIVHNHDLDLWHGSRSNVIILIESTIMTSFYGNDNVCHIGQAICCQNMHHIDYDLSNGPRSNANTNRKPMYDLLFDGNNNFIQYVTISKIFLVEMCIISILTFKIGQRPL